MIRLRIDLAYDGRPFRGFARQRVSEARLARADARGEALPDASADGEVDLVPTVQQVLELALHRLLGQRVATTCAGRTDAGVHALGQVVHGDVDGADPRVARHLADTVRFARQLDRAVGDAVTIWSVEVVGDAFDARFSATSRRYRYRLHDGPAIAPLERLDTWHVGPPRLDVDAMRDALGHLVGEHDFASFCRPAQGPGATTVRRLLDVDVTRVAEQADRVDVVLHGTAFCHQQVRATVGCLVRVGHRQRPAGWLGEVLAARDRAAAAALAPPHGLVLEAVRYEA